jgi:hypothetical protein
MAGKFVDRGDMSLKSKLCEKGGPGRPGANFRDAMNRPQLVARPNGVFNSPELEIELIFVG